VLLRVSTQERTLLSAFRTACRDSMFRKVGTSGRIREFAPSGRTAREHLIASQSRISTLESALLSAFRTAWEKSMLHKVESCDRF
jgi:hypothetical protein